jgi:hypothetical protein
MTEDRGVIVERKAAGVARGVVAVVRKAGADTVRILAECVVKKPFWIYIFMLSLLVPVRLVFYHFHYTWPTYGIRMFGEGAKVGNMYGVLNPTIIVFLAPLVAVATKNVKSYKMLLVGTLVSVGAVGLAVIPSSIFAPLLDTWFADLVFNRWLEVPADKQVPLYFSLLFFVALFTIGEAIWSPRLMQFTAEIAPGGKEGSYIALSYLPFFLAKIVAGPMSGWLVKAYTPEGQASYPDHYMVWVWIGAMAAITPLGLIAFRFLFRRAEIQDAQAAT